MSISSWVTSLRRVPLAWLNLTHQPRQLVAAASGVGFAVLLMFMQLGFRGALIEATLQLPRLLNADLVMSSPSKITLSNKETFSRRRLIAARDCPGVAATWPFYMLMLRGEWRNPQTHELHPITVYAFDPHDPVLAVPELPALAETLLLPGRVLFDRQAKPAFGSPRPGTVSQLSGERVEVVGGFDLGADFVSDGNILMSDQSYRDIFFPPAARATALAAVDLGLIKLEPDADPVEVRDRLRRMLGNNIQILTRNEFIEQEQTFWQTATPVGYIFGFGTVLGFVVGVLICYQVLYSDIANHLSEYATLKALGYPAGYFMRIVFEQSLWLAVIGFVPGALAALGLYATLAGLTHLPLHMTLARGALVLSLTLAMCMVSGALTIRRLLQADPAELFR